MADQSIPVDVTLPPIDQPLFDRASGFITEPWYRFFETLRDRSGGDIDAVDANKVATSQVGDKVDETNEQVAQLKENEVIAGRGLEGGGTLAAGVRIDAKQQAGWVLSTGAGDRVTPYVQYASPAQAELQAVSVALAALSARYVALEAAVYANEGIAGPSSP